MKNPISILARIIIPILILFSCHKEHQIITTDKEFPPTVKLIRANIHGVITDYHTGAKLDGIIVELVVEGVVLQRTATFEGAYRFDNVEAHKTHSLIRTRSRTYAPNYATPVLSEKDSNNISFQLKQYTYETTHLFDKSPLHHAVEDKYSLTLNKEDVERPTQNNSNPITILSQYYEEQDEIKALMLAVTALDKDNVEFELPLRRLLYFGAWENNTPLSLKKTHTVPVSFVPDNVDSSDIQLWQFDHQKARWVQGPVAHFEKGKYLFQTDLFTYFAIPAGCKNDITKPIPYCITNVTVVKSVGVPLQLWGSDFNVGSYDNCSKKLTFELKKIADVCNNGSTSYHKTIEICDDEIGKTIQLSLKVTDQNGNWDNCIVSLTIAHGDDCNSDKIKPTINIKSKVDISLDKDNSFVLHAKDMDINSSDNCPKELTFKIRKLHDICNYGGEKFKNFINFCKEESNKNIAVEVKVIDKAGNFSTAQAVIFVNEHCADDKTRPTPYCRNGLTIVMGSHDKMKIHTTDIDLGSYDDCSKKVDLQIKRTDDPCNTNSDQYSKFIYFCQSDIGKSVTVTLKVTDDAGNWSYCTILVQVKK